MLVTVRAVLEDGRVIELARDVGDAEHLSPAQLLEREAHDGSLSLSDHERVALESIARAEFVGTDVQRGPGWLPGLQDEDAASASASNYDARGDEAAADDQPKPHGREARSGWDGSRDPRDEPRTAGDDGDGALHRSAAPRRGFPRPAAF